jgi:hypothetical protein
MARSPFFIEVKDSAGNIVTGAAVELRNRATGLLATVYQAETGGTTLSNPLTVDAFGRAVGWVDRGDYNARVAGTGLVPYTIPIDAAPAGDRDIDITWLHRSVSPTLVETAGGAGTTPASPGDADRFIWTASTPSAVSPVEFRYRSASASSYKWENMGGSGFGESGGPTTHAATAAVWYNLATLAPAMTSSFTAPFTGDYDLYASVSGYIVSGAAQQLLGFSINAANPSKITVSTTFGANYYATTTIRSVTTLNAGDVLRMYGQISITSTWNTQSRHWAIVPIRVL